MERWTYKLSKKYAEFQLQYKNGFPLFANQYNALLHCFFVVAGEMKIIVFSDMDFKVEETDGVFFLFIRERMVGKVFLRELTEEESEDYQIN